ncbi:MAG: hypothetical protein GY950_20775 [bacterium]|nr:hypothetical protein [bacterium]
MALDASKHHIPSDGGDSITLFTSSDHFYDGDDDEKEDRDPIRMKNYGISVSLPQNAQAHSSSPSLNRKAGSMTPSFQMALERTPDPHGGKSIGESLNTIIVPGTLAPPSTLGRTSPSLVDGSSGSATEDDVLEPSTRRPSIRLKELEIGPSFENKKRCVDDFMRKYSEVDMWIASNHHKNEEESKESLAFDLFECELQFGEYPPLRCPLSFMYCLTLIIGHSVGLRRDLSIEALKWSTKSDGRMFAEVYQLFLGELHESPQNKGVYEFIYDLLVFIHLCYSGIRLQVNASKVLPFPGNQTMDLPAENQSTSSKSCFINCLTSLGNCCISNPKPNAVSEHPVSNRSPPSSAKKRPRKHEGAVLVSRVDSENPVYRYPKVTMSSPAHNHGHSSSKRGKKKKKNWGEMIPFKGLDSTDIRGNKNRRKSRTMNPPPMDHASHSVGRPRHREPPLTMIPAHFQPSYSDPSVYYNHQSNPGTSINSFFDKLKKKKKAKRTGRYSPHIPSQSSDGPGHIIYRENAGSVGGSMYYSGKSYHSSASDVGDRGAGHPQSPGGIHVNMQEISDSSTSCDDGNSNRQVILHRTSISTASSTENELLRGARKVKLKRLWSGVSSHSSRSRGYQKARVTEENSLSKSNEMLE